MFHMKEIETVPIERLNEIIVTRHPRGLFLSREKRRGRQRGMFIAVDNSTGDAWTEEFKSWILAEKWLTNKEMEV